MGRRFTRPLYTDDVMGHGNEDNDAICKLKLKAIPGQCQMYGHPDAF